MPVALPSGLLSGIPLTAKSVVKVRGGQIQEHHLDTPLSTPRFPFGSLECLRTSAAPRGFTGRLFDWP
jgi:hypothetical protein